MQRRTLYQSISISAFSDIRFGRTRVGCLIVVWRVFLVGMSVAALGFLPSAGSRADGSPLGIGFLWARETEALVSKLSGEKDFVDLLIGPASISIFEKVKPPVRVLCITRALAKNEERPFLGVGEVISLLTQSGVKPERVIIGYNPEALPGTPRQELEDLVGSVSRAQEMAKEYGAPLLVAPGLMEMRKREQLYPELAKHCDMWMIQTQQLQWTPPFPALTRDPAAKRPASPEEYRERVKAIVDLLRQGNPEIKIYAQILSSAGQGAPVLFDADQVVRYASAIHDLIEAVRVYGGGAEVVGQVIERLRPAGEPPEEKQAKATGR